MARRSATRRRSRATPSTRASTASTGIPGKKCSARTSWWPAWSRKPSAKWRPRREVSPRRGAGFATALSDICQWPAAAEPPANLFVRSDYESPGIGKLPAWITPDPGDGEKHPAIVWITGGDSNSLDDFWSSGGPDNDQSASAWRRAGMIMMFPTLRGGNTNGGKREFFLGEVDDVIAAARHVASLPYVDRVFIGVTAPAEHWRCWWPSRAKNSPAYSPSGQWPTSPSIRVTSCRWTFARVMSGNAGCVHRFTGSKASERRPISWKVVNRRATWRHWKPCARRRAIQR